LSNPTSPFNQRAAAVQQEHRLQESHAALTDINRGAALLMASAVITVPIVLMQTRTPDVLFGTLIIAVAYFGSGLSLRIYQSRFLAGFSLALALLSTLDVVVTLISTGHFGGGLGLLALAGAFLATRGTFRHARLLQRRVIWSGIGWNCLALLIYAVLVDGVFIAVAFSTQSFWNGRVSDLIAAGIAIYLVPLVLLILVALQWLPFTRRATYEDPADTAAAVADVFGA